MAPEGRPFVLGGVILTALALGVGLPAGGGGPALALAGGTGLLTLLVAFFFRDPPRRPPEDPGLVVAPADGRILSVEDVEDPGVEPGPATRIAIFLSLFDVHVQRSPLDGRVTRREHRSGGFAAAWGERAGSGNERTTLGIASEAGSVLVHQIAGLVARRIVTDPEVGDRVRRGERIGLIRFGSRVELLVPRHWEVLCTPGQRARAGETPLVRIPSPEA